MGKKQEDNKIQELEQKVVSLDSQLKRAVADYRNLEARVSQGRSELTSFVGTELVKKLLPVLDHLEQALSGISEEEKTSGWVKGVELAVKEFNQVLKYEGLEEIAAEGQFDPSLHEAVDTGEGEDNKILKVVRKGFRFNGKVLRPAGVVVGRKSDVIVSEATPKAGEVTPESEDSGQGGTVQGQARMTEEEQKEN